MMSEYPAHSAEAAEELAPILVVDDHARGAPYASALRRAGLGAQTIGYSRLRDALQGVAPLAVVLPQVTTLAQEDWQQRLGIDGRVPLIIGVDAAEAAAMLRALQSERARGRFPGIEEDSNRRLSRAVHKDTLTSLSSRDGCSQLLESALRSVRGGNERFAFLRINLQGLGRVNQGLGYQAGDELILQAVDRLEAVVGPRDVLCRLGGNEFGVIVQCSASEPGHELSKVRALATEACHTLERPYQIHAESCHCRVSLGVTQITGKEDGPEDIMRFAEIALQEARLASKPIAIFDRPMLEKVEREARLVLEIEQAIKRQEFILYYQPVVSATGELIGAEGLVRWQHPTLGLVSPGEFISSAEESGLITPLGRALRRQALAQLRAWAARKSTAHLVISVNVSSRELHTKGFAQGLLDDLQEFGADPKRLKLEVTESLLLTDQNRVQGVMEKLGAVGIGFSLDDFGTGYSSLSYLKQLPFDTVKLDRSFVNDVLSDPIDASLCRAIIAMGHGLGLRVIAEGVESEAQVRLLVGMGCSNFQGYYFARPAQAAQLEKMARRPEPHRSASADAVPRISDFPATAFGNIDLKERIVAFEPDPSRATLFRRILAEFENLEVCGTESELRARLAIPSADLVLLDTSDGNDLTLCENLHRDGLLEHLRFLLITGMLEPHLEGRALQLGVAGFVNMPLSAARLMVAVRNQLLIAKQQRRGLVS